MNQLAQKQPGLVRAFLYILLIGLMLAVSVTSAASAFTITVAAVGHGTIDPPGSIPVNPGDDSPMFIIAPDSGYHSIMTIDGTATPGLTYKFSNVKSDHSISVTFAQDTGTINVNSDPTGASVFIDGIDSEKKTPATVDVPVGTHLLQISLKGYDIDEAKVSVVKDTPTKVDHDLKKQSQEVTTAPTVGPTTVSTTVPTVVSTTVSTTAPTVGPTAVSTTVPTVVSTTVVTTVPTGAPTTTGTTVPVTSTPAPNTTGSNGQISFMTQAPTVLPTPVPTSNLTPQPNTTVAQVTNGTPLLVTPGVNVTPDLGTNNPSVVAPVGISAQVTRTNGPVNMPGPDMKPPTGLPPWNVVFFLFIVVIPLALLLSHDYFGLGHLSFPQPLAVRAGVAIGQVVCMAGLLFVLSQMIALLPADPINILTLPLLIVLLFGAYLIFSALALAIGSLLSRPLRWTLKVHVVIGVITLLITPIPLFLLDPGGILPILATIVAAPVSALLALWQDHSLALEVQKRRFPFGLFNGDETRVSSGTDPYRRSTATRPDMFPPELADRYASIDFLGRGGISHVYRAMRLKDGMTVAVKIPIRFDETTGKCFMKEILAWEGLRHPNIVEITDVNILPIPYVEMEFVKSGLAELKTPLPVSEAVEIISGVADGLAYAHEQGIIHRDIKPQNILIDRNGVPKISDWGMSRLIGSSAMPTVAGFSLAYASPEQISPGRFGETDERTDIYQLGVVFYELVTGKLLFPGDDLADISNAIISRMPVPPSEVNPQARPLDPIILKCLQKNPDDRYQSVRMLLSDLKQLFGSPPGTRDYDSLFDGQGGVE